MDLCFIEAQITDERGIPIYAEDLKLTANVSGAGSLIGFGSGNPVTDEQYGDGTRRTWKSKALLVVRAAREAGDIEVVVTTPGLLAAITHIQAKE